MCTSNSSCLLYLYAPLLKSVLCLAARASRRAPRFRRGGWRAFSWCSQLRVLEGVSIPAKGDAVCFLLLTSSFAGYWCIQVSMCGWLRWSLSLSPCFSGPSLIGTGKYKKLSWVFSDSGRGITGNFSGLQILPWICFLFKNLVIKKMVRESLSMCLVRNNNAITLL